MILHIPIQDITYSNTSEINNSGFDLFDEIKTQ